MSKTESEIVVGDPGDDDGDSPPVTSIARVEVGAYLLLIALAAILGYDNWRSGAGWATDGPQAGYLPFYLSMILGAAALFGLATVYARRSGPKLSFVTRSQFRRVLQVFLPTLLYCAATQWLGIYVASFLLIALFMRAIGRIAWWKSIVTGLVFAVAMFLTFEIAFDVLMPKGPLEALFGY